MRRSIATFASIALAVSSGLLASSSAAGTPSAGPPSLAPDIVASTRLPVSGLREHDNFGTSVAISGSIAIVGAPFDDNAGGTDAGAAYVFTRSGTTWSQEAVLTGADTTSGDQFGTSVDVFSGGIGTHVVVGAPFDDNPGGTDAGAAYVFTRVGTTWTQSRKVTIAHNRGTNDRFGSSVAIARSDALVGVPMDDTTGANGLSQSGSVTAFFRPEDWGFRSSLTAGANAGGFELFGTSVEMSALTAVVGAPEDDQYGSVYVFVRPDDGVSPWTQHARLRSGFSGDGFGESVAVSGDVLFVGEPRVSTFLGQGLVYAFERVGTGWQQTLRGFGPEGALAFGQSVAIGGIPGSETVIVGAPDTAQETGAAYVYRRSGSGWSRQDTITALSGGTRKDFGFDVDFSAGTAVIGVPRDNTFTGVDSGTDTGSAYVVSVP